MKKVFMLFSLLLVSGLLAQPLQVINSGTTSAFMYGSFLNNSNGFAVLGTGNYLKTVDGGSTWIPCVSGSTGINSMCFINTMTGFSCGQNGTLGKTTNGGVNWTYTSYLSVSYRSICFVDSLRGYIVGAASVVLMTTNAGLNWQLQNFPIPDVILTDVKFINGKGYITADNPRNLFVSSDGGNTWLDAKIGSGLVINRKIALQNQYGYVAGYDQSVPYNRASICFTSNGGTTWQEKISDAKCLLYGVAISPVNPRVAIAVGRYEDDPINHNRGYFRRTTNGGETWTEESWGGVDDTVTFRTVSATNTDFFLFGSKGQILKTSHIVSVSQIGSEVPQDFKLAQNFPNPFNPSTTIRFALPKVSAVSLTVTDLSGRIVARLVENDMLAAGTYQKTLNAGLLSSGIYFYTLQTDTYTDTKKMMLIK